MNPVVVNLRLRVNNGELDADRHGECFTPPRESNRNESNGDMP